MPFLIICTSATDSASQIRLNGSLTYPLVLVRVRCDVVLQIQPATKVPNAVIICGTTRGTNVEVKHNIGKSVLFAPMASKSTGIFGVAPCCIRRMQAWNGRVKGLYFYLA